MPDITLMECIDGINKLGNTFGQRFYSDDRKDLIYNYVKSIPKSEFNKIINKMISTSRNAPLPKDFEAAAKEVKNRIYNQTKRDNPKESPINPKPDCVDCNDSGMTEAQDKKRGDFCVHFICHCGKPRLIMNQKIPQWSKKYEADYILLPQWPDRCLSLIPTKENDVLFLVEAHAARIKNSEDYWDYHGF